jgi:hypothetical protein
MSRYSTSIREDPNKGTSPVIFQNDDEEEVQKPIAESC